VLLVRGFGTEVALQHLTITGGRTTGAYEAGGGIRAEGYTALALNHATVRGNSTAGDDAYGGGIAGAYVTLTDSTVSGNHATGAIASGGGIFGRYVTLTDSTVSGNTTADAGGGIFGEVTLNDSTVSGNTGGGIFGGGTLTGSTVRGNTGDGIAGFNWTLVNSTISGNTGLGIFGNGALANSTVAGNAGGIEVASFEQFLLRNSIIADNGGADIEVGVGTYASIASNGHNIFGSDVEGDAPGDLENVPASLLFAGGLADNGGVTQTIALRDAPDNPAIDAADPATAPELDQRGFARVGAPDAGSFEAGAGDGGGGFDGLPPLAEKVAVDPALINGVDAGLLRGDGATPFTVTFLGGVGAKDNALGYYVVQEDDSFGEEGLIIEAGILFGSTEDATPGAAVQVRALQEGQTLGLFLVADGADLDGDRLAGNPQLSFFDRQGNTATVGDPVPDLFLNEPGDFGPLAGEVLHASDFVRGDRGNALNPDGAVRALSGRGEDGSLLVAWED
jgi:hypothetical protein